jgi:hypothetical protein
MRNVLIKLTFLYAQVACLIVSVLVALIVVPPFECLLLFTPNLFALFHSISICYVPSSMFPPLTYPMLYHEGFGFPLTPKSHWRPSGQKVALRAAAGLLSGSADARALPRSGFERKHSGCIWDSYCILVEKMQGSKQEMSRIWGGR